MEYFIKRIPLGLFCLQMGKSLFVSPSMNDAAVLFILGSAACFFEFFSNNNKIEALEAIMKDLKDEKTAQDKRIDSVQTGLTGVKLNQRMVK